MVGRMIWGELPALPIALQDRFTCFGFELLAHLFEAKDYQILMLSTESLNLEQEMVQNLMKKVHCFSFRLYGLRNCRKTIQKAL